MLLVAAVCEFYDPVILAFLFFWVRAAIAFHFRTDVFLVLPVQRFDRFAQLFCVLLRAYVNFLLHSCTHDYGFPVWLDFRVFGFDWRYVNYIDSVGPLLHWYFLSLDVLCFVCWQVWLYIDRA